MTKTSLLVIIVTAAAVSAQTSAERAAAVSEGKWATVLAESGSDPASRFLHAHSLAAQGSSDQAVCAFADLATSRDFGAWDNWTREFVARHPMSATAHYLRGDALARIADWSGAAAAFDKALALEPRNTLALNARGILRTITGNYDAGLLDFASATTINRTFADAYINRGYLYVQRKASSASAIKSFDAAIALNRIGALAMIGRGQSLVMQGRSVAGLSQIESAPIACDELRRVAEADRDQLLGWVRAHGSPSARGMSKEEAGNTLLTLMKDATVNKDVKSINRLTDFAASSGDSTIQNKTKLFLESWEKTDSKAAELVGRAINEKKIENETLRTDLLKQSTQQVSSEADLSLKYKANGFDIGGSVKAGATSSLKNYADEQLKLLDQKEDFRKELNTTLNSPKQQSGGAETMLIGLAIVERGDGPRIYHNTLFYGAASPGQGSAK